MRSNAKYLHSIASLKALDALNAELSSSESIAPALARSIAHETRRAAEPAFTAVAMVIALATGAGRTAYADAGRTESAQLVEARRAVQVARDHLKDVRASERAIKAHARDERRAAKLRASLAKVEASLANGGGK